MDIVPLQTDPGVPIYLITVEDQLAIVRILQNLEIQTLVEEYGVQSYNVSNDSGLPSVAMNIDDYDGKRLDTYQWDPETQNFLLQANAFERTQTLLEDDLYNRQDYAGVIASVDQFLSAAPAEPQLISQCGTEDPGGCTYLPAWYVPYFRFLRGLAYEQLGQDDAAEKSYYELWQDFPKHIFGIASRYEA